MADKTQQPDDKAAALEINELMKTKKISRALFAGLCAAENWRPGKMVTEKEFDDAVKRFSQSPIDGRKQVEKNA